MSGLGGLPDFPEVMHSKTLFSAALALVAAVSIGVLSSGNRNTEVIRAPPMAAVPRVPLQAVGWVFEGAVALEIGKFPRVR